jgi:hypothetical protein
MLITVEQFCDRVRHQLTELVLQLQEETGRFGDEEKEAWTQSLPKLSTLLCAAELKPLHLYISESGYLKLEYQLPASGCFADAVLLGRHQDTPAAVIVEMKHWVTRADRPGRAEGLVERAGRQELHPSDQVRGYTEYCRYFHSAVLERQAAVHGCVLFTRDTVRAPYEVVPNVALVSNYPIFTLSDEDRQRRLPEYLSTRLTAPDGEFAAQFAAGRYKQDRGFIKQIAGQIVESNARPFELLDNQRRALSLCTAVTRDVVEKWKRGDATRQVVAVIGPPGSGKSAVAARLWANLSLDEAIPDGNISFVTTSMSQNANWADIFEGAGGGGARGVVRKATTFHPITTGELGRLRGRFGGDFLSVVQEWPTNLQALRNVQARFREGANDLENFISIVDEAHSLINPGRAGGVGQFGFAPTLGPQAYHIIRSSVLSIFLLDPKQGFRHRENTSLGDLRAWTKELGGGELQVVELDGVQFRCGGSTEYVDWVESLLRGEPITTNRILASAWHQTEAEPASAVYQNIVRFPVSRSVADGARRQTRSAGFEFSIFDDPFSMESALRKAIRPGETARLLSTYSRRWKTRGIIDPHTLTPTQQDFCETVAIDGGTQLWHRPWNVVPESSGDYTHFVQGKPESRIAQDQLCEVGCPYAVRGFDYDYVGLLWLEDLVWRDGKWILNLEHMCESGLAELAKAARRKKNPSSEAADVLLGKVAQAYRILMTRALKGVYVWVKDSETRHYLRASISSISSGSSRG